MMYIHWQACMEAAACRSDVANEILSAFVNELPDTSEKIKQYWQAKQFAPLIAVVHKLHGGCCYTGVPVLKQLTSHLEQELNAGHTACDESIEQLLNVIDAVIKEYQEHY